MTLGRGFREDEYRLRVSKAQGLMAASGISALLLTTEPEIQYFTGFMTRFWESPTRPWFLVLPAQGAPVAVIPTIGEALMGRTWVRDIRTWVSPDPVDDGVSLLADTLREIAGFDGRIGVPSGPETHLRMPLDDFETLRTLVAPIELTNAAGIIRSLRATKSEDEIDKIRNACAIAGRAFGRLGEVAAAGVPLERVFRGFQALCLEEGADAVPYLAGGAGRMGYDDVISPAGPTPLAEGDVLMLDTGVTWDGYFSDFDRNVTIGTPAAEVAEAHARLVDAADAAFEVAQPGQRACDLFRVMADICGGGEMSGRFGHGLGLQLTEGLSIMPDDATLLAPGMVLTLEPWTALPGGGILVHEEVIAIRKTGAEALSPFADRVMPQL